MKLSQITLSEQLIKYGYFPEQIPPCFCSKSLYEHFEELKSLKCSKFSECVPFSLCKKSIGRRLMRIPNPENQIALIRYILDEKEHLMTICNSSSHTLSNPFNNRSDCYSSVFFDIPRLRDLFKICSGFLRNLDSRIKYSLGYKYIYKIDLSSFYDSIYTHTLEWAIIGRDQAKQNLSTPKKKTTNIGMKLDNLVRSTNSLETAGIPTGPYTSRIISEILLVSVDRQLEQLGLRFLRYVDDYEFYFKSEEEILKMQSQISRIFSSYRLHINEQKTEIRSYPYHFTENLNEAYYLCLIKYKIAKTQKKKRDALMFLFFKADGLFSSGQIGAYKYLFKFIKDVDFTEVWETMESYLVNIILIKPELAEHIVPIVCKHVNKITTAFKVGLYENLLCSVNNGYHNEAQWLFWILLKVEYSFSVDQLSYILQKSDDDILRILVIDYSSKKKASSITLGKIITDLYTELSRFNFQSEHWLIQYTCYEKKWFDSNLLESVIMNSDFAKGMIANGISFYDF